ncbi:TPA: DUF551 domain-containing protein [Citrobacter freundii]|uniref:DUF551 domain-containing protein n=2 Tax=Citrobacter freundii TaxID=546 RepID=UPI0009BE94E3|nr:DUF551 domain-containing protein [Citrobacter freundii]MDH0243353.1 DUF551 domain-containing protein [Citrobacter freundii]MDH1351992.1 DUF551 domain-containing protein [Citrobacter freundii]MDH1383352.1 DUF551 domain-containing protein [Citrobacter freundii]MDH1908722.1 DUF551 domain-containing protein [Citrobacter freundii]MDT7169038.1 DUF551 domain-containing protein [Citrobacter freundii]
MNEFTREELEKIADTDHVQCGDASALARMALAAMDSEPVGEFYEDGPLNWYQISEGDKVPDNRRIPLYRHAQPAQTGVDDDVRNIIGLLETNEWAEHCTETVLGSCLEAEITRLVGSSQPAPVVPDEDPRDAFERTFKMPKHVTRCGTGYAVTAYSAWLAHDFVRMWEGWNACRAAMLQGAEPASNCDELPLDYLQGHKDGLEWAAQLAKANHPETGDWLYDDPIELSKAIRKGPDMPLSDGNSPVIQDGWIKCSERMPEDEQEVLTRNRMGHCFVSFFDEHSGLFFDRVDVAAACCIEHILVTHWMPLPAAPQQEE